MDDSATVDFEIPDIPEPKQTVIAKRETAPITAPDAALEEAVIAQVCKDGGLTTAQDAGLEPDHFSDTRLALLYSTMSQADDSDNLSAILQMKGAGQIDDTDFSGLLEICRLDTGILTLRTHCAELIQRSARRKASALEHRAALYLKDGNRAKAQELLNQAEVIAQAEGSEIERRLDAAQITTETEIEAEPVILKIADNFVASKGNLIGLVAQKKSGKTAYQGAVIASSFGRPDGDYLHTRLLNPNNLAILRFDTEQSAFHHQRVLKTVEQRAGCKLPPHVLSYKMRGWTPSEVLKGIETQLRRAKRKYGGIALVLLDGIAQCVADVNDPGESAKVVSLLSLWAEEYETAILATLHLNPSSETKSRGHLGSEIERLCETQIQLARKDGAIELWADPARNRPIERLDAFRFEWSDEAGMFVSIAGKAEARIDAKASEDTRIVLEMTAGDSFKTWRHKDFIDQFVAFTAKSESTAKRFLARVQKSMNLSYNSATGYYSLGVTARKVIESAANADKQEDLGL